MKSRFLMTAAAAALIASAGLASAQSPGSAGAGSSGGAPAAGAPATGGAPSGANAGSGSPSAPAGGAMNREQGAPAGGAMNRDTSDKKGPDSGTKATQSNDKMQRDGANPQRAQDKAGDTKSGSPQQAQDGTKSGADTKSSDSKSSDSKSSTTTGQAGAPARLSTEQRTQVKTVIQQQNVRSLTSVNFSISVGTKVPRSGVTFYPVPTQLVTIYPQYRGFQYVLVKEEIIIIDPNTFEIVAVIQV